MALKDIYQKMLGLRNMKALERVLFYGVPIAIAVVLFGSTVLSYLLPVAALLGIWWFLGLQVMSTDERGVKTLLGKEYATVESGLRWIPFLLGKILRYPTSIYPLDFPKPAGIVTRAGKARDADGNILSNGRDYGPVTLDATISMLFEFPKGDDLLRTAKLLPPPTNKEAYIDLFEEPVLDQVRTNGGDEVWINLVQRRAHFAKKVLDSLKNDPDGVVGKLLRESGLTSVKMAIKHLQFPEGFMQSISAQEKAELDRRGIEITARGERKKRVLEGEGAAIAKKNMLDVIRKHPENIQGQALLTLIEMAQGPATTIFPLSTDLTNVLGGILKRGGPSEGTDLSQSWNLLTNAQKNALLQKISEILSQKTGGGK